MQQSGGLRLLLLFMFCWMFCSNAAHAQSKMYFVITGKIVPESGTYDGAVVEIMKNGAEKNTLVVPRTGRFRFELDYFNEYVLTFQQPGSYPKQIVVSTDVSKDTWPRKCNFPQFLMAVLLFQKAPGVDAGFASRPVGKIFYEKQNDRFKKESYLSDVQIAEQIESGKSLNLFTENERKELRSYQLF